jgi:hypothetical protein
MRATIAFALSEVKQYGLSAIRFQLSPFPKQLLRADCRRSGIRSTALSDGRSTRRHRS